MKIKNYEWNGFGFPVIFDELPAVKVRGELVPDIDFNVIATPLIEFVCMDQAIPLSGNQVKFIRHHLNMNLREFAKFMGVTHQSVMRWEKQGKAAAHMEAHVEFVFRYKVLKAIESDVKVINRAMDHLEDVEKLKSASYKQFRPLRVPQSVLLAAV